MHRLSLVVASGGYSLLLVHRLLIAVASLIVGVGSWHTGFGSCGAWAYLPHHMWNLPGPGIKPMSAAGEGHFGEKDRCHRELGGGTRAL